MSTSFSRRANAAQPATRNRCRGETVPGCTLMAAVAEYSPASCMKYFLPFELFWLKPDLIKRQYRAPAKTGPGAHCYQVQTLPSVCDPYSPAIKNGASQTRDAWSLNR